MPAAMRGLMWFSQLHGVFLASGPIPSVRRCGDTCSELGLRVDGSRRPGSLFARDCVHFSGCGGHAKGPHQADEQETRGQIASGTGFNAQGGEDQAMLFYGEALELTEVEQPPSLAGWLLVHAFEGASVAAEIHLGVESGLAQPTRRTRDSWWHPRQN